MKISIAMASYNGENYLEEQLESFVVQHMQPDELIISDDGSIDRTIEIIRHFAKTAPFEVIWWQNEQNLGYGANFNKALQKASGDFVFLSDQDDVWFTEKISDMVKLAEQYPQAMVFMNDAEFTDINLNPSGATKLEQIKATGRKEHQFVMGCCAAVRKEFLDWCLPIKEGDSHDGWIVTIADSLNLRIVNYNVLQYYRQHGENQSKRPFNAAKKLTLTEIFLTRKNLLVDKYSKSFNNEDNPQGNNNNRTNRLQSVKEKAPKKYQKLIHGKLEEIERLKEFSEYRNSIRQKNLFSRIYLSSSLFFKKNKNGIEYSYINFFRDIVG